MPLYTYENILDSIKPIKGKTPHENRARENKVRDSCRTVTNKNAVKKEREGIKPGVHGKLGNPLESKGLKVVLEGDGGDEWRTDIRWEGVHKDSLDGTKVVANPLGPDHKLGEAADKSRCPNADILNDLEQKIEKCSTKNNYQRAHLLHNELGGPGNDERNLVALPTAVNKEMGRCVEPALKTIINEQKGWVYYKATVEHDEHKGKDENDKPKTYHYANKISCLWYQIKKGDHQPSIEVPGTRGEWNTPINPPCSSNKLGTRATTTNTEGASSFHADTARAKVSLGDIVLTTWDSVKSQGSLGKAKTKKRKAEAQARQQEPGLGSTLAIDPLLARQMQEEEQEETHGRAATGGDNGKTERDPESGEKETGKRPRIEISDSDTSADGQDAMRSMDEPDPTVLARMIVAVFKQLHKQEIAGDRDGTGRETQAIANLRKVDFDLYSIASSIARGALKLQTLEFLLAGMLHKDPEHYGGVVKCLFEDPGFAWMYEECKNLLLGGAGPGAIDGAPMDSDATRDAGLEWFVNNESEDVSMTDFRGI